MRVRSGFLLTALLLLVVLVHALPARAADTNAPAGAPSTWLPDEQWVMEHWLPYDERDLAAQLPGWDRAYSDRRTLAQIARQRGRDPERVVRTLLRQAWGGRLTAAEYAVVLDHARRTFTQGHLTVHLMSHLYHTNALTGILLRTTGLTSFQEFGDLRNQGLSIAEMGALHGRTLEQMRRENLVVLRRVARLGVRLKQTPAAQEQRYLGRQERYLTSSYLGWTARATAAASSGAQGLVTPLLCSLA